HSLRAKGGSDAARAASQAAWATNPVDVEAVPPGLRRRSAGIFSGLNWLPAAAYAWGRQPNRDTNRPTRANPSRGGDAKPGDSPSSPGCRNEKLRGETRAPADLPGVRVFVCPRGG